MPNKAGKYIVFCKNVEDMEQKIKEAQAIFSKVNRNIETYRVSYVLEDRRRNQDTLERFAQADNSDTLKLMFSIEMLNEGYHLPDIDGVVMMRPTQSPTIYLQQMGRALNVGNKEGQRPVIIDLVDNFNSIEIIADFAEKMRAYESTPGGDTKGPRLKRQVSVYDYTKQVGTVARKIEKLTTRNALTIEEKVDLFEKFQNEFNEPIVESTIYEGYPIGSILANIRMELHKNPEAYDKEIVARLKELGLLEQKVERLRNRIDRLAEYVKNNVHIWFARMPQHVLYETIFAGISDDEERDKCISEGYDYKPVREGTQKYIQAQADYAYIRERKSKGKLTKEQISKLKEAGVGGVFGNPTSLEELSDKYNIEIETLIGIVCIFGSMDKFREEYVRYTIYRAKQIHGINSIGADSYKSLSVVDKKMFEEVENFASRLLLVKFFDKNNPELSGNHSPYFDMLEGVSWETDCNIGDVGTFIDVKKLKFECDSYLKFRRYSKIVKMRLGLDGYTTHLFKDINDCVGVKSSDVMFKKAMERITKYFGRNKRSRNSVWDIDTRMDPDIIEAFIRKYFENHDIFYSDEHRELDDKTKKELFEIANADTRIEKLDVAPHIVDALKAHGISYIGALKLEAPEFLMRFLSRSVTEDLLEKVNSWKNPWEENTINWEELGLPLAVGQTLEHKGVHTMFDLVALGESELIRILGIRTAYDVIYQVYDNGFEIKASTESEETREKLMEQELDDTEANEMKEELTKQDLDDDFDFDDVSPFEDFSLDLEEKVDNQESTPEQQLEVVIAELKSAYDELQSQAQKCGELRSKVMARLEEVKAEKVTSSGRLAKLQKMVKEYAEILEEMAQLEAYQEKIKQERAVLEGKETEENTLQTQLQELDAEEEEIEAKKVEIKKRASEMDLDF